MAVDLKKPLPNTFLLLLFLIVNNSNSTEVLDEKRPCQGTCSEKTVTPAYPAFADTSVAEILTITEGTTEIMSTTEDRNQDKTTTVSTEMDIMSTKYVEESTTSKPEKIPSSTIPTSPTVANKITPSTTIQTNNATNPFGDFCQCDLTVNSCDVNCCCDVKDCSEKDQEVFSGCLSLPAASSDPRLCLQYEWISASNHTVHLETYYNKSSLLCIDRDNNPSRLALQNHKPINSIEDFHSIIEKKIVFKWPTHVSKYPQININSSYKAGDILWSVNNVTLYPLAFLSSGFNTVCQSKKWIRFLHDDETSCTISMPYMSVENKNESSTNLLVLQEECSKFSTYMIFKKLVLLSSPQQWPNFTSNVCPPETCVITQQWICNDQDITNCQEREDIPNAHLVGETCFNMLMRIRLVINVVGAHIHSAEIYFVHSNISLTSQIPAISRKHSVIFNWWSNESSIGKMDKDKTIWRRSGNPGYILGRPVMAGWKETVVLGGDDTKKREDGIEAGILEGMRVIPDPNGWLTVLGPEEGGHSCGGPRRVVQFGYSARWSCSFSLSPENFTAKGCKALKRRTLELLLGWGSIGNLSDRYIATFGDSSLEKVNEWIPLTMISSDEKKIKDIFSEKMEPLRVNKMIRNCAGVISSINLQLATALVGSVTNPQAKLVGAVLKLGEEIDVVRHHAWISWYPEMSDVIKTETFTGEMEIMENKSKTYPNSYNTSQRGDYQKKYLILVSSVKFIDVTGPPVMEVAPPPVYHIRLPYGFFHPFLSCASSQSYHLLAFIILLLTNLCYGKIVI